MGNMTKWGPWIRRFLLEHLVSDRNLARNTQQSYRDTLALLLPFVATRLRRPIDELEVAHVSVGSVRQFLQHLEQARSCGLATRNQRLAVIHAFARFIGEHSPEHIEWSGQVRAIPFKKAPKTSVTYLEKTEMDALLAAPNRSCVQGNRDYSLLLFLYNTGARADEAARLTINDLHLSQVPHREQSFVQIRGKGNKQRMCPLWPHTTTQLKDLIGTRDAADAVFLNRCAVDRLHDLASTPWWSAMPRRSPLRCRSWRGKELARTQFDIQPRRIYCAQGSTSIRFVHGLGTSRLIQPISMPKQISR